MADPTVAILPNSDLFYCDVLLLDVGMSLGTEDRGRTDIPRPPPDAT